MSSRPASAAAQALLSCRSSCRASAPGGGVMGRRATPMARQPGRLAKWRRQAWPTTPVAPTMRAVFSGVVMAKAPSLLVDQGALGLRQRQEGLVARHRGQELVVVPGVLGFGLRLDLEQIHVVHH